MTKAATKRAGARREKSESMRLTHTDELLRKHQLLLVCGGGIPPQLIDWLSDDPASPARVQAYLLDLKNHPGFPGAKIAAELEAQAQSGALNREPDGEAT